MILVFFELTFLYNWNHITFYTHSYTRTHTHTRLMGHNVETKAKKRQSPIHFDPINEAVTEFTHRNLLFTALLLKNMRNANLFV